MCLTGHYVPSAAAGALAAVGLGHWPRLSALGKGRERGRHGRTCASCSRRSGPGPGRGWTRSAGFGPASSWLSWLLACSAPVSYASFHVSRSMMGSRTGAGIRGHASAWGGSGGRRGCGGGRVPGARCTSGWPGSPGPRRRSTRRRGRVGGRVGGQPLGDRRLAEWGVSGFPLRF
jgi:hypothetical protein